MSDKGFDTDPTKVLRDENVNEPVAEIPSQKSGKRTVTRRDVLLAAGCGVAGLVAGGALASWGVTSASIASGRMEISAMPTKMLVTDRARCSGCQRCEMMCTLRNDGVARQSTARVRVGENYQYGNSVSSEDGIFGNCQFTIKACRQCEDAQCAHYCPVHAIYADPETGARVVDEELCIGCGMCSQACPWNMPVVDDVRGVSTKCIACGRCAEQCPNGAIQFIDWEDIAQACIDQGLVSSIYATSIAPDRTTIAI